MSKPSRIDNPDVVLIGGGIMSAHLGSLLKRLDPSLRIQVYEAAEEAASESSNAWNNAGTGHAGICELSYTPFRSADGTVNVEKAISIFEQFELSRLFWANAVSTGMISSPKDFVNPVPHISFVYGDEQVAFLRDRHAGMAAHHYFSTMEYSTDPEKIRSWAPLLVEGRGTGPIAATHMSGGTDVNFGSISRKLLQWLSEQDGCGVALNSRVVGLQQEGGKWHLTIRNLKSNETHTNTAKFVFVGAGGGSLPLLQKAAVADSKGMGGFPVGGQWLVCDNPEVVKQHQAKVYGQAQPEAPTMAVPHLDTRVIDGKKLLLFGPFASWTTKFLHNTGSFLDMPLSIRPDNIATLLKVGVSNLGLVKYLVQQGTQSMSERINVLRRFYPSAQAKDWKLIDAGIRVQAIKKTDGEAGIVHYGTEIVASTDRTLSGLMGASPGASVCVHIALEVIETCLPHLLKDQASKARLLEIFPTYDVDTKLPAHADLYRQHAAEADRVLQLV